MEIEPEELIQSVPSAVARVCEDFKFHTERQSCGGFLHRGTMRLRREIDSEGKVFKHVTVGVREYYLEDDGHTRTHIMVDVFVGFRRRQRWVSNYLKLRTVLNTLQSTLETCGARKLKSLESRMSTIGFIRPR